LKTEEKEEEEEEEGAEGKEAVGKNQRKRGR